MTTPLPFPSRSFLVPLPEYAVEFYVCSLSRSVILLSPWFVFPSLSLIRPSLAELGIPPTLARAFGPPLWSIVSGCGISFRLRLLWSLLSCPISQARYGCFILLACSGRMVSRGSFLFAISRFFFFVSSDERVPLQPPFSILWQRVLIRQSLTVRAFLPALSPYPADSS